MRLKTSLEEALKPLLFTLILKLVRVVKGRHGDFLKRFKTLYSTSANLTQCAYDKEIASNLADVIVSDERGLFESVSSKIFRLYKHKKVRVR